MWENDFADLLGGRESPSIKLAVMTAADSCRIGNLELKKEDLLFNDRLVTQVCTKVSETAPSGGGKCTDKSSYSSALKAGDIVAVYQLSDSKFLVLGRMISL